MFMLWANHRAGKLVFITTARSPGVSGDQLGEAKRLLIFLNLKVVRYISKSAEMLWLQLHQEHNHLMFIYNQKGKHRVGGLVQESHFWG